MQQTVGIRFKQAGKIYYFKAADDTLKEGDKVIAETKRGIEMGTAICILSKEDELNITTPLKPIERKATPKDNEQLEQNKKKEQEAFKIALKKIAQHNLPMKLIKVECTFDLGKIIFYFTADGRIDFRELVKDLASIFHTRIELRQIGVRDEAKLLGGIGICGRGLCCNTFLEDFIPVSIKMAKEQNLSLNPTKISGVCGRLMCCLKYENDCYCKNCPKKKVLPPHINRKVITTEGEGVVFGLNDKEQKATIRLQNGKTLIASWEDIIEEELEETFIIPLQKENKEKKPDKKNAPKKNEQIDIQLKKQRQKPTKWKKNYIPHKNNPK